MSDENQNEENQNEENQNEENQQDENQQDENQQDENQNDQDQQEETNDQESDSKTDDSDDTTESVESQAKETVSDIKEGWNEATKGGENKKLLAGILGIVVGGFGVHKFILGYNKEGFILLGALLISLPLMCVIVGAFTIYIPILIGFIEGIIYLTKSDEEFYETYQANKKPWF
jgi:TM2 domain-containing membrane protein YozV